MAIEIIATPSVRGHHNSLLSPAKSKIARAVWLLSLQLAAPLPTKLLGGLEGSLSHALNHQSHAQHTHTQLDHTHTHAQLEQTQTAAEIADCGTGTAQ